MDLQKPIIPSIDRTMIRAIVFGQSHLTEEATRHTVLCNAMDRHLQHLSFSTFSVGFAKPDATPGIKMLTAFLLFPFRWTILAIKYLLARQHDILFLPYPSYMDGWLGIILGKFRKKKIILDSFVCIYDTLINDRELFYRKSLMAKLVWHYEKFLLSYSDVVLVDTLDHKSMLVTQYKISAQKIEVIPVGINEELWKPLPFYRSTGFQVLFWCTFIPLHGASIVAEAAGLLKEKHPDIRFLVIGIGQEDRLFKNKVHELGLDNLKWIDKFISLGEIHEYMTKSHCCLGVFGNKDKTQRVIPYKAYQALASGRALITAETNTSRKLFTHLENAVLVPPHDPKALAEAILCLYKNTQLTKNLGINGRRLYEQNLSNAKIDEKIRKIIESI